MKAIVARVVLGSFLLAFIWSSPLGTGYPTAEKVTFVVVFFLLIHLTYKYLDG